MIRRDLFFTNPDIVSRETSTSKKVRAARRKTPEDSPKVSRETMPGVGEPETKP
jgi:hypothetical protein